MIHTRHGSWTHHLHAGDQVSILSSIWMNNGCQRQFHTSWGLVRWWRAPEEDRWDISRNNDFAKLSEPLWFLSFNFLIPKYSNAGTISSCIAHILTAVIGSGVLSLAWSIAQLGWIAGPVYLLCLAAVTYVSASLLSDCYRSPDPVTGTRNYSYGDAVRVNLGTTMKLSLSWEDHGHFLVRILNCPHVAFTFQVKHRCGFVVSFSIWACTARV